jgi:hypothetical protein
VKPPRDADRCKAAYASAISCRDSARAAAEICRQSIQVKEFGYLGASRYCRQDRRNAPSREMRAGYLLFGGDSLPHDQGQTSRTGQEGSHNEATPSSNTSLREQRPTRVHTPRGTRGAACIKRRGSKVSLQTSHEEILHSISLTVSSWGAIEVLSKSWEPHHGKSLEIV